MGKHGSDVLNLVHPYVRFLFAADPVLATQLGAPGPHDSLGPMDAGSLAAAQQTRRELLAALGPEPAAGTPAWLDHQVLRGELRTALRREEDLQPWRRAPYLHAERLGEALTLLMQESADELAADLTARLRDIPRYLADAGLLLEPEATPQLWAEMGAGATAGLRRFVATAVPTFAGTQRVDRATAIRTAAEAALPAIDEFAGRIAALTRTAGGSWSAGTDHVDAVLADFHHTDHDASSLLALGENEIERATAALVEFAARRDRSVSWQEQIDRIKDAHPQPEQFRAGYEREMRRARRHVLDADLLSIPDGEDCRMEWVPEFQRESLPLGVMHPVPPYSAGLVSTFLITPADPTATAEQRLGHQRENSYAFQTSIAGHETYPGHHLQAVHHKLGTAPDGIRRYFRTPLFVEGWGLYVEDLLAETGLFDDQAVQLVKHRNTLWRALRVVIDMGLHTGTLGFAGAVALLRDRAGMARHLAEGEVRRYTRHDNPTYPSSYMLGRMGWHELRAAWHARTGGSLRAFHDTALSFGSPPLSLLHRVLTSSPPRV